MHEGLGPSHKTKSRSVYDSFSLGDIFLKVYPTENEACSKVGGIDEKTWRKIIWWIIDAIADLELDIVSIFIYYSLLSF